MASRRSAVALVAVLLLLPAADEARPSPFGGSTWRLVAISTDGRTTPPPPRGAPHLLTFEDGTGFRSEICNHQDGTLLRLGPVYVILEEFSTLMLCAGALGVADDVVASSWPTLWSVRGDELRLRNKKGALTFVRHPADRP